MNTEQLVNELYDANPGIDLLKLNLHSTEVLGSLKLSKTLVDSANENVLEHLKQVRRVVRLHPEAIESRKPLSPQRITELHQQFDDLKSAHDIARKSIVTFVQDHAAQFGSEEVAAAVHQNAVEVTNNVANLTTTILNLTRPLSRALVTTSVSEEVTDYFQGLVGYQDLFGDLNYCDCSECKSVVGPAAYFVDLLRIIQKYVTEPNKDTVTEEMKFNYRRPDLPLIYLTCDCTNTIIPYLTIINERLEYVLERSWSIDRTALYKRIAATYYPFNLPYLQPLSNIRIYVDQLKTSLAEVFTALQISGIDLVTEQLGLSKESWQLLATAADDTQLKTYYGVSDLAVLSEFDKFSTQTNLLVTQIEDLLYQNLSGDELKSVLNKQFFINKSLTNPVTVTYADNENKIENLNTASLDQINRFVRLSAQLRWTYDELDWALHALGQGTPDISSAILSQVPALQQLVAAMNTDVTTTSSLLFDLKTYGIGDDPAQSQAPFDVVFNTGQKTPYHPKNSTQDNYPLNSMYKDDPWPWLPGDQTGDNPTYALRVASALGISQGDLTSLAQALFGKNNTVTLNVPNISALYRHVLMAGQLQLTIPAYLVLLDLAGLKKAVFSIADALKLLNNASALGYTRLTVYDINYIVNAIQSPTVNILYYPDRTEAWLKTLPSLVTSAASDADARKAELLSKLYQQVATFFNTQPSTAETILKLVVTDPLAVFLDPDHTKAVEAVGFFSQWLVFTQKANLGLSVLLNIAAYPGAYGMSKTTGVSFGDMLNIISFQNIIAVFSDVNDRFTKYIAAIVGKNYPDAASILSDATGWNKDDITTLISQLTFTNEITRLAQFATVFDLLAKTGLNLSSLNDLKQLAGKGLADWELLVQKQKVLLAAIQARYNTGSAWDQLLVQINGKTGAADRDAIMPAVINDLRSKETTAWVRNARNLNEYLLIDVDMSACAQISYIKEGLNAAQLYLNRCRAKLEPGINVLPIPEIWWEWMMNYRVWQANREIFLYPENYIDPAYRASKTALFQQLENDLKQNDITQANVTSAYTKYLEGFAELAKLVYVDAYYCKVSDDRRNDQPTLFLFARTTTDPYVYYYIIRESEGTWSEWTKIDLSINAAYVTPVYAFNRLFLFWVERNTVVDKSPNQKTETIYKANINYTFYNFQGQWVPTQSLVKDYIINADPSDYRDKNKVLFPDDFFDASRLWWNKVYPLDIHQGTYWEITGGGNRFEELVIAFGPMLDTAVSVQLPANDKPSSPNAAVQHFEEHLYKVRQDFTYAQGLGYKGQLPIFRPVVLNNNFDSTYLVNPDEIIFLEQDSPFSVQLFTPQIDSTSGQLNLINTDHTIYENDIAQQIIYPAIPKPAIALNGQSFISTTIGIDSGTSQAIYDQLKQAGYIDSLGYLKRVNFEDVRKKVESIFGSDPKKDIKVQFVMGVINNACGSRWLSKDLRNKNYGLFTIKNAVGTFVFFGDKEAFLFEDPDIDPLFISDYLYNADTWFHPLSFVSAGAEITDAGSKNVYDNLIDYGYLDQDGILTRNSALDDIKKDLVELFKGQPKADDKVDVVLDTIANSPLFYDTAFISSDAGIDPTGSKTIYNQLNLAGYLDDNGRLTYAIDFNDLTQELYVILQGQPNIDLKVRFVVKVLYQASYPTSIGFFKGLADSKYSCEYNFKATRLTTGAIHNLSARIFAGGVDRLLQLESQLIPVEPELPFSRFGFDEPYVTGPEAIDGGQVDFKGAYEIYYWELFFHAPMYIASLLKTNQTFDQAEKWYKYIFDPTAQPYLITKDSFVTSTMGVTDSQRIYTALLKATIIDDQGYVSSTFSQSTDLSAILPFITEVQRQSVKNILLNHQVARAINRVWRFLPFRNHKLQTLLENITNQKQIDAYNQYPFDPNAIARLRIGAYEKYVVMQYIDNLVKWGDWYFTQYTWESITTASMLYIYAYNLLGPRPENLGPCSSESRARFTDIVAKYGDNIPQFKITLEDHLPTGPGIKFQPYNDIDAYFCVPENSNLDQNWEIVIDRLYKINNCLNIAGIKQPLALFEPPIDPALLARAAASGGNPLNVLNQGGNLPAYRFEYLIDRVKNLAATLSQLGNSLLAALEKKDESSLQRLQATQQSTLLNLTTLIKEKQIEQAKQSLAGLQQNLLSAQNREQYYLTNYTQNLNSLEIASLALMGAALYPEGVSIGINGISVAGYLAPNIFGFADGGMKFGDAINAGAQIAQTISSMISQSANIIATTAQFIRRREEWLLEQQTAMYDIVSLQDQIAGATAQLAIAQQDLSIHKKTIEQQDEYEKFLTDRFTNTDLYVWMISRLSAIYFQTYQMTLEMALATQSAYQYEMDTTDTFIQFDYWDNLHKGLLAAEGLLLSLEQMERTYTLTNTRRLEIEKTISLLQLNPQKFIEFKTGLNNATKGQLLFSLTEQLYDFDFPGQYCRKIKSISITIPAVVGPYQNINAMLRLKKDLTVVKASKGNAQYAMNPQGKAPDGVRVDLTPKQKIALSRGVDDTGLFVLNFSDSMYLPFEGAGAVSDWELSIPPETNHFDFNSISDVIVKISYTALEDMGSFATDVRDLLTGTTPPYPFMVGKQIVLQQAFSASWYQFMHPQLDPVTQQINFQLTDNIILPNLNNVALQSATVIVLTKDNVAVSDKDQNTRFITFKQDGAGDIQVPITNNVGNIQLSGSFKAESATLQFTIANTPDGLLTADKKQLDPAKFTGLVFILNYTSNVFKTNTKHT
ncbi:MAG TPA: neuraminidase-like domain-containing protein [Chitinophagaceae bacterium]|nr:neuraminidase-like domain-containing protein [Chitinophagaceae bacterium]